MVRGGVDKRQHRLKSRTKTTFRGNRYASAPKQTSDTQVEAVFEPMVEDTAGENTPETISATKVKNIDLPCNSKEENDTPKGYSIFDMDNLCGLIEGLCCPGCKKSGLSLSQAKKQGFAIKYVVSCVCGHNIDLWSSKKPPKVRSFEINQGI